MLLLKEPSSERQYIMYEYCCVHAAFAIKEAGLESIMVNCNPETVSTDYDTSHKLYFEPLTVEDVLSIYNKEKPDRPLLIGMFLEDAIEAEADAIADKQDAFVPAVMQHIEYAGIHSGDSACVIPPVIIHIYIPEAKSQKPVV